MESALVRGIFAARSLCPVRVQPMALGLERLFVLVLAHVAFHVTGL